MISTMQGVFFVAYKHPYLPNPYLEMPSGLLVKLSDPVKVPKGIRKFLGFCRFSHGIRRLAQPSPCDLGSGRVACVALPLGDAGRKCCEMS